MEWCPVCGASHRGGETCRGEILATGPERHGWRVTVETPRGVVAHGILVAPTGRLWRARILTYPNVLWTVPGGRSTLKFVAPDPRQAESAALSFVQEHCRTRGHRILSHYPGGPGERIDSERAPGVDPDLPPSRKIRALPVRFGLEVPDHPGLTANLSLSGLFISTSQPADAGAGLRMALDVQGEWLTLRGTVVWHRLRPEVGRPLGMGLRLTAAPENYALYVRGIP